MARTIAITGSASGIGQATAALLAAAGHRVIGIDRRDAEVLADLATGQGRAALVEGVSARCGGALDAVVAAAGIARADPATVSINYFGAIATLAGLRPLLERGNQPRAVVLSSITALSDADPALVEACLRGDEWAALQAAATTGQTTYAATKVAVARWVRRQAGRPDWAGRGILLNAVAPGYIATAMTESFLSEVVGQTIQQGHLPLNRPGYPAEIAHLINFLISPENSYLLGQVIFADGGMEVIRRGDSIW